MLFVLAGVGIISAAVTSWMGYSSSREAIEKQVFERLVAVRETKGNHIEDYFGHIVDQTQTMAESPWIVQALGEFRSALQTMAETEEPDTAVSDARDEKLRLHYKREFLRRLEETSGTPPLLSAYWPSDRVARQLQQSYLADSPFETGSKHLLDASRDGTEYSAVHRRYHPLLRNLQERFGFYDIFLVDHESGRIVYTVFKEVDFGTSLVSGPYRESNLGRAFRAARDAGAKGFVKLVDFEPYDPSYGAQASFIAAPVYEGDEMAGVLAFQMPVDEINETMTSRQEWRRVGLGETGETYIVGDDQTLRNQSRFLLEDQERYLRLIEDIGVEPSLLRRISKLGSSIGLQAVRTGPSRAALKGETGHGVHPDYRGIEVFSAYRPLDIPDLNWAILSELDAEEALAPVRSMRHDALLVLAGLFVVIVVVAFLFSRSLTRPIANLARSAQDLAGGDLDREVSVHGRDEIADLAQSFESMRMALRDLVQRQEREIDALAVPLIPLGEDILAMPLVGELDPRRLDQARHRLVDGLHGAGVKGVLMDLTGVPHLDRQSAERLVGAAKAARLMGVQVVLTGMQAEVAKNVADLEVHLDGLETAGSLECGVRLIQGRVRQSDRSFDLDEEENIA
jgi:anti-anti-sigma regulatory factor/HAMP domain-containing protein